MPDHGATTASRAAAPGAHPARFNGKVESYRRFRPGYPPAILGLLQRECALTPDSPVVDIAAGTGLFSEIFLNAGNPVTALEPNDEMRAVLRLSLPSFPRLTVVNGTAEATGLPAHTAAFVTAAQAMHWFDLPAARAEFRRILRPGGWCLIACNERRLGGDPFHDGYESLLRRFAIDYALVQRRNLDENALRAFFAASPMRQVSLSNAQVLDREALIGRIVSSSYMPNPGQPGYPAMLQAIDLLFARNETNGRVQLDYTCQLSYGHLS